MADESLSGGRLWFVTLARDALNEGHRVIAHHLNLVLLENAPDVHINADPMRTGDSLRHAAEQFRQALPGLRTRAPLPARDSQVNVWTLGYINWTNNPQCFVTVDGMDPAGEFDLGPICTFLRKRRSHWPPEVWRECIQAPVEQLYSSNLAALRDIETGAAHNKTQPLPSGPITWEQAA